MAYKESAECEDTGIPSSCVQDDFEGKYVSNWDQEGTKMTHLFRVSVLGERPEVRLEAIIGLGNDTKACLAVHG